MITQPQRRQGAKVGRMSRFGLDQTLARPQLFALSGPLEGRTIPLEGPNFTVGRSSSNALILDDPSVSPNHCRIEAVAGGFQIEDLDSQAGTLVNEVPVRKRELRHGDRITLGECLLLFVCPGKEEAPGRVVKMVAEASTSGQKIRLAPEETILLSPQRLAEAVSREAELAIDLNVIFKISRIVSTVRSLEILQEKLLELLLDAFPADTAAILLFGKSLEDLDSFCVRDRKVRSQKGFPVSRSLIQEVVDSGDAVLLNNIPSSREISPTDSIIDLQIQSVLCVPILSFERRIGVVYLDSRSLTRAFQRRHLELLTVIVGLVSGAIENALRIRWLEEETKRLREELPRDHEMVGESPAIRKVLEVIARAAPTDATILITGESGTGKELAARAIHRNSSRSDQSFVAINCAALAETLLESELFGHEKGAFTGAFQRKRGKLEIADGGTLFLDEISEMPLHLQSKLLRFLEERQFERVGGTTPLRVDLRIIASSNRKLEERVAEGQFREDLYYRLNVVHLWLPPLRERRSDIPLLAGYFVRRLSRIVKRRVTGLEREAQKLLQNHDWPGNIRELKNAIERAVVLGTSDLIQPEDLPMTVSSRLTAPESKGQQFEQAVRDFKKRLVLKAMEESGGNYTRAARQLGLHPNYLHRLIRNLDLKTQLKP